MRNPSNRMVGVALLGCAMAGCLGCSSEVVELPGSAQANASGGPPPPPPPAAAAPAAVSPAGAFAPVPAAQPTGTMQPAPNQPAAQPAARLPDVPAVLGSDPDEKGPDAFGSEGPPGSREEAQAGVGVKGRGYGGGLITEPIRQKFTIEQRLVFQVQIPEAMKLYKASNDNKAPKTHEAFMRDIIEANSIRLPQLPEGDTYIYDPKLEKLMVQHPPQ